MAESINTLFVMPRGNVYYILNFSKVTSCSLCFLSLFTHFINFVRTIVCMGLCFTKNLNPPLQIQPQPQALVTLCRVKKMLAMYLMVFQVHSEHFFYSTQAPVIQPQESEVLSIIKYRGTSKIAGKLKKQFPSDLRGAPIPYY